MDLYEFQKNAIRTEKVLDGNITINKEEFSGLLAIYQLVGDMLDAYKKKIFYGKDSKYKDTFNGNLQALKMVVEALPVVHQYKEKDLSYINTRVFHGILGILTESGELAEIMHQYVADGELDSVHLFEELADGAGGTNSWYSAILCDALNVDPYAPMEKVIAKLKARYPEKYEDSLAENRNLEAERAALEKDYSQREADNDKG